MTFLKNDVKSGGRRALDMNGFDASYKSAVSSGQGQNCPLLPPNWTSHFPYSACLILGGVQMKWTTCPSAAMVVFIVLANSFTPEEPCFG